MVAIHSGHLQKSINRVMRLPETKHKYLRRIDKKQAVIIGIVLVVTIILSILFFLAKYNEVSFSHQTMLSVSFRRMLMSTFFHHHIQESTWTRILRCVHPVLPIDFDVSSSLRPKGDENKADSDSFIGSLLRSRLSWFRRMSIK